MKTLPSTITNLKNQLAVSGAWLTLMDIYYPDAISPSVERNYVNDNSALEMEDPDTHVIYEWDAASFQVEQITEEVQMSLPKISIILYQPQLSLRTALQTNDGMSGGTIVLRRVYKSNAGIITDIGFRQEFTILDVSMADTVITFSIGIADPLARRFPRDNYGALTCRHKYKGGFCRYVSTLSSYTSTGISFGEYAGLPSIKDTANGFLTMLKNIITPITGTTAYMLKDDITITVSGSLSNNKTLAALSSPNYPVYQDRIYVVTPVTTEIAGASISLLSINIFSTCTHTLEDAPDGTPGCRSHNNSNQFGGNPGAAEGIFYSRQ